VRGIKANGSARSPAELEALGRLDGEAPESFARDVRAAPASTLKNAMVPWERRQTDVVIGEIGR
jgi:hypothetical protein